MVESIVLGSRDSSLTLASVLYQSILDRVTVSVACQLAVHIVSQLLRANYKLNHFVWLQVFTFLVAFNYANAPRAPD